MSTSSVVCYHCSHQFSLLGTRLSMRESCPGCKRDLHCCRNCQFYDSSAYNGCREPQAERVVDKEKGNLCDYFRPSTKGTAKATSAAAKSKLDDLFKK